MENFIQKFLTCRNMTDDSNFVSSFPIIIVKINDQIRKLLVYKFTGEHFSNYAVLGILDEDLTIERESFVRWLESLSYLIHLNPRNGIDESYNLILSNFKNNYYARHILYTQEGYDLITNKPSFSPTGSVQRTVMLDIKYDQGIILFGNECFFDETNKVLENGFFHSFEEYERNYFLNRAELKTWGDITAVDYACFNIRRLSSACKTAWVRNACTNYLKNLSAPEAQNFLLQLLDSVISQKQQDGYENKEEQSTPFKM